VQCHDNVKVDINMQGGDIALVGHANVGKSVLFQKLTGQRAIVSNYPGTTVEVTRGVCRNMPEMFVVDTPGLVTLPPHTEDEIATERILLGESLQVMLQVGDAKSLERTLLLTVQLAEMNIPMILALNMMDEANARGLVVDHDMLSQLLNLAVIPTTAVKGEGVDELSEALKEAQKPCAYLEYPEEIENALDEISKYMPPNRIAVRALGLLYLRRDIVVEDWLSDQLDKQVINLLSTARQKAAQAFDEPLSIVIQSTRLMYIQSVIENALEIQEGRKRNFSIWLGGLAVHPLWGLPILALALYALYWFVGVFGAQVLVEILENRLFGVIINPWISDTIGRLIPIKWIVDLLVGEYGLWTMGMTYALALILPIVSTFFLAFSIMEDSGYLPRLAALSNRFFRFLGLNGKAVLPMVLGLGCVTMATLTTRILESKRDRFLVTLLLALAIPCSAQLGVLMGMLAGISLTASIIWGSVVMLVLLAVGWLAARLVPGDRPTLLLELPPMRWPVISNVLLKTLARLEWYLKEVVPLFLFGASLMFLMDRSGVLVWLMKVSQPLVSGWLGLPAEVSSAFLLGFMRRDFGATSLFIMQQQGLLSPLQVLVAMVTVTLFVPCIASLMIISKERGWRTALGMTLFIFPVAFFTSGVLYRILSLLGWS
jgi:ferrous iron transport protein B